mmetsp:Transcript_17808/g.37546  ORF Transcript_17808/g.37546 Transcript_17808/m.37546 type:complete len:209 (-) Transcript_17808:136-762(-)
MSHRIHQRRFGQHFVIHHTQPIPGQRNLRRFQSLFHAPRLFFRHHHLHLLQLRQFRHFFTVPLFVLLDGFGPERRPYHVGGLGTRYGRSLFRQHHIANVRTGRRRRIPFVGTIATIANAVVDAAQWQLERGLLRTNEVRRGFGRVVIRAVMFGGDARPHSVEGSGTCRGVGFVEAVEGAIAVSVVDLGRGEFCGYAGPAGPAFDGGGG